MWRIPKAYIRVRNRRLINTIICTACACVCMWAFNASIVTSVLGATLTGIVTWFLSSSEVDTLYKIHTPGGS